MIFSGSFTAHKTGVVEVLDATAYVRLVKALGRRSALSTCGECGRVRDDSVPTAWTPAPSGRCPFEDEHEGEEEEHVDSIDMAHAIADALEAAGAGPITPWERRIILRVLRGEDA